MELDKFLSNTDFEEAEQQAAAKADEQPEITDDEADCDGCKI